MMHRVSKHLFPDIRERSAPIETARSVKLGTVHTRYSHWRTGDHRPEGLLIASGPGFAPGAEFPPIEVEDLGPSVAARLGIALDDVDGAAISWLAKPGCARALSKAAARR